jgi:3',5'-cyclic AMP phosphodiesterase CpdA
MQTLAHVSDLHLGSSKSTADAARRVVRMLVQRQVDQVVVTGDITDRGRPDELALFEDIFEPLKDRLTVVPGNHDRLGWDMGRALMSERVDPVSKQGLFLVRVDSTGEHNRAFLQAQGDLCRRVLREVDEALDRAPKGALVAVLLHHHVFRLPEDLLIERMVRRLGFGYTKELPLGAELLEVVRGRCDLVLHGHRHNPTSRSLWEDEVRPLTIYNAGSSTHLEGVRLFTHSEGRLTAPVQWLSTLSEHHSTARSSLSTSLSRETISSISA